MEHTALAVLTHQKNLRLENLRRQQELDSESEQIEIIKNYSIR